jgi:hypothetical protein
MKIHKVEAAFHADVQTDVKKLLVIFAVSNMLAKSV